GLPAAPGKLHSRSASPRRAVLALGLLSAGADLVFDLRPLIAVGGCFMLAWYFITHYAALHLPARKRLTSPIFSWYGIVGCVGLTISMPAPAVVAAAGTLAALTVGRRVLRRGQETRGGGPGEAD